MISPIMETTRTVQSAASLSSMDPGTAISRIENDLRFLVGDARRKNETEWLTDVLGEESVEVLKGRQRDEAGKRKPARVPTGLLAYTHLRELRTCLDALSWSVFAPALGKKAAFEVLLDRVERYRNSVAHSRQLLPYEKALLEGIAGVIRTGVTIHRSTVDQDNQHYPLIEMVRDSFGNDTSDIDLSSSLNWVVTKLRVQVGDVITFEVSGWDAQGRELTWELRQVMGPILDSVTGEDARLTWIVSDSDVGIHRNIRIQLKSSGQFHRCGQHDQSVHFTYTVDPPAS